MTGPQDLGGRSGFGAIDPEPESVEPVFHHDWERRIFGMQLGVASAWNLDKSRFARERQEEADYLRHSYYENWLAGLERLTVENGLVTVDELASGRATIAATDLDGRALRADDVATRMQHGFPVTMESAASPRFRPGDRVRALDREAQGHTREPGYVRGHVGIVAEHHGSHRFPDLSAEGKIEGHHLYSVRFDAGELWGDRAEPNGTVVVDLWEDYLEAAP